jgi:type I restriction enzyme S subunit
MFDVEETPRTVGLSRHHGMITGAYDVYRSDDSLALEYLTRLLLVLDENKALAPLYRGLRKTIPRSAFESLKVPMPSKDEQGLIVRYLDHAELRIAKAIAAKQALMNRLLELRHVQIAEGILGADGTRLLNSSLPYNVPESWCVEPFWSVAPEVSISDQQGKELLSVYLNRGVIRYSESAGQVHKPSLDLSGYQLVRPGDLVMNNQQAWRGSVGVSRYEGIVSPAYVVCSLEDRFDLEYANMLFRSPAMVSQFEMASRGVGSIQRQLHRQTLRVTKVPIPPLEEQVQIATRLVAATKGLDRAIQSLENEIALLKEYRTRLISDVVTGKLDVRTEAAKLPEIDPMELATVAVGENGDDEEATDDD